jgi:hypothetical protein
MLLINPWIILLTSSDLEMKFARSSALINSTFFAISINVCTSINDPLEVRRNCRKLFGVSLPQPSAMFAEMETDARLIWLVKPYLSFEGNLEVSLYTSVTRAIDCCHAIKSLYDWMLLIKFSVSPNHYSLITCSFLLIL